MPAFSFTAPGITPEMELAERETLPKDVWDQVQNEVHGWDAIQQHEITDDDEDDECTEDMDDDDCEISSTGSHHDRSFKSRSALPPIPLEAVDEMMYESCQLPKTQIQDYLDAKEKVPHLVEEESCVEGFLRCEKFSPKVGFFGLSEGSLGVIEPLSCKKVYVKITDTLTPTFCLFVCFVLFSLFAGICCTRSNRMLPNDWLIIGKSERHYLVHIVPTYQ